MISVHIPEPEPPATDPRFVRRVHRMRTLGLGLGFFCVASVFYERGAHPLLWALLAADGLLWPHVAYALAARADDPVRSELRNLLVDSLLGGVWVALMAFNLLPSVLLVTMLTIDKIAVGGWRFAARAALLQTLALVLTSAAAGFPFAPASSMTVVVACMPFLVAYPLAISTAGHALSASVRRKNRLLAELSRTDSLTGLPNRTHWEEVAAKELRRSHRSGRPASLLMIDIDDFKLVNDRHGHPAGDELLRRVGALLKSGLRDIDTPCRYGGDEFCIVLPETGIDAAVQAAERLRQKAEREGSDAALSLRSTISIGAAEGETGFRDLRAWVAAADAALYRAKASGRNRVSRP